MLVTVRRTLDSSMTSYDGSCIDGVLSNQHRWLTDSTEMKTTVVRVSFGIFSGESSVSLFSFACRLFNQDQCFLKAFKRRKEDARVPVMVRQSFGTLIQMCVF
ncbi:hypothetical protein Hanom_Chr04g00312441 [Helianthus anomalus]